MNRNMKLLLIEHFDDFLKLVNMGVFDKDFACNTVIEDGNWVKIYEFARYVKGADISKLEEAIIKFHYVYNFGSGCYHYYIIEFARYVKGANISKLEDIIVASGSQENIVSFARNVEGANVLRLEDALLSREDLSIYYILEFARYVKGADISKLEDAVISLTHPGYLYYFDNIYNFARYVKGADIKKLEDALIKIGTPSDFCEFALDIETADITKLENAVIAADDANEIYNFALIKGANVQKLENALINSLDPEKGEYISYFAANVEGANIQRLEKEIIKIGNVSYISSFAHDVKGANVEKLEDLISLGTPNEIYSYAYYLREAGTKVAKLSKLEDAVAASKDSEIIYQFARNIKGANIQKLEDAIIRTKNVEMIMRFASIKGANQEKLENAIKEICKKNAKKEKLKLAVCSNPYASLINLVQKKEFYTILELKDVYNRFFQNQEDKGMSRKLTKEKN